MKPLSEKFEDALYTHDWFNPSELKLGYKETFEIYPDGKVVRRYYEGTSRKISEKEEWDLEPETIAALFDSIVDCMQTATDAYGFVDDCGATLKLSFWGGEIILPRGLGTEENCIGWIMERFISTLRRNPELNKLSRGRTGCYEYGE